MKIRLMILSLLSGIALAADSVDFAWQWPLPLAGDEGLVSLQIGEDMYRHIQRADLRDLAAFNGNREMIPLMPVKSPEQVRESPSPTEQPVPWFRVPRAETGGDERISLLIAREPDGRLSRLQAEVAPEAGAAAGEDLLVDLSALESDIATIAFGFELAPGTSLNARVDVDGSDDLSRWRSLARGLPLVDISAGDARLQRHRLVLPATRSRYLRIRRTDAAQPLPVIRIGALEARRTEGVVPTSFSELAMEGEADASEAGTFHFRSPGPFPVRQVNLRLADRNAAADVILSSRDEESQAWRQRARFTAFQIESDSDSTRNLAQDIGQTRDRLWRAQTVPAQSRAPTLELAYAPDRFLLMTQGEGPFLLAAGSVRVERPDYPLGALLADLQKSRGKDWQPPQIEAGPGSALSGDAALQPTPEPLPLRRWLLWGVLTAGAGVLLMMVISLLRQPQGQGPEA